MKSFIITLLAGLLISTGAHAEDYVSLASANSDDTFHVVVPKNQKTPKAKLSCRPDFLLLRFYAKEQNSNQFREAVICLNSDQAVLKIHGRNDRIFTTVTQALETLKGELII